MNSILKLEMSNIIIGTSTYYKMVEYEKFITLFETDILEMKDLTVIPFYITKEGKRYELYQYELSLLVKENPDIEKLYLTRTGGTKIEELTDKEFVSRTKNILYEVKPNDRAYISNLRNYFKYLLEEDSIINYVSLIFDSPSKENLYFEVY